MHSGTAPKYARDFFLEFRSVDRFLYRVSDLHTLTQHIDPELLERLDNCHLYILAKRPRLSIVPESIQTTDASVVFRVEYKIDGVKHQDGVELLRQQFLPQERVFEVAPYPHRELVTRNDVGEVVAHTLLANVVHLMPAVQQQAKDLEVLYIGKGLRHSAQDRLDHHATLQRILANINSNEPDSEVFALVYGFKYQKNILIFSGVAPEISGNAAKRRREKVMDYRPSLDEQISLVEASCISYFRPTGYNTHYLDFPGKKHQVLRAVYEADFAAIVIQLDNTNIGGQRIFSQNTKPANTHYIVVDFRGLEGKMSLISPHT